MQPHGRQVVSVSVLYSFQAFAYFPSLSAWEKRGCFHAHSPCQPALLQGAQIMPPVQPHSAQMGLFFKTKEENKKKRCFLQFLTLFTSPLSHHVLIWPPAGPTGLGSPLLVLSLVLLCRSSHGPQQHMSWEIFWSSVLGLACKQLSGGLSLTSLGLGL